MAHRPQNAILTTTFFLLQIEATLVHKMSEQKFFQKNWGGTLQGVLIGDHFGHFGGILSIIAHDVLSYCWFLYRYLSNSMTKLFYTLIIS